MDTCMTEEVRVYILSLLIAKGQSLTVQTR